MVEEVPLGQIDYDELLAFIVVAFALMGSPGPATLSLAATGAAYDIRAARKYLAGIMFGVMLVILGVAAGIFAALIALPYAREVLTVVAALYLAYLAYRIATAPPIGEPSSPDDAPGFATGFILNLSNPKAYAAFGALFSGFQIIPQSAIQSTYLQVAVCYALLCIVNPGWLYAGSMLRRVLRDSKTSRRVNIAFAILLILSVLMVVFL
ncbi:MAG: LysE family translocator [Fimbriimonadaceae bacterium]|nr:LysE family translocator [Alphaproteobacteria bacterium]